MTDPTNPPTPAEIAEIVAEEYGNLPEPDATCPSINAVLKAIISVKKDLKRASRKQDAEELYDVIECAVGDLENEIDLEPLRKQNIELRDWGLDWKNTAVKLKQELDAASRGIAPPSGEVEWALGYLDSIAIRVHDTEDNREKAFDILRRLSAPPVAAGEGERKECSECLGYGGERKYDGGPWLPCRKCQPKAAPSGEAAPREAGDIAELIEEGNWRWQRAEGDGKSADWEINANAQDELGTWLYENWPRLSRALRTLYEGKAAAEAESNANAAGWKDAAERAEVMKQTAEGWKEKSDASESRCAALERALDEAEAHIRNVLSAWRYEAMQGDGIHEDNSHVYDAAYAFVNRGRQIISVSPAALASAEPAKPEMPECVRVVLHNARVMNGNHEGCTDPNCSACERNYEFSQVESYYAKPSATAGEGGE